MPRLAPLWRSPLLRAVVLALLFVPGWSTMPRLALLDPAATFIVTPVSLLPGKPGPQRLGALIYERGYRLSSTDPTFGGFSSLLVSGDHFTLLSDGGGVISFRLDSRGEVSERRIAELPAGPGSGWQKSDRDSESMTQDPHTGALWVAFENSNEIWRYRAGLEAASARSAPRSMREWPPNGGAEAMVRQRDGSFLVLSETESLPGGKGQAALYYDRDPTRAPRRGYRWGYRPPRGLMPTDIAALPDGRLLVLNRRFSPFNGFRVTLTLIDPADIGPGKTVAGREIAQFADPVLHDNFEGIAVVREARGGTAIWIVSDDNQSSFQQSLLLKFHLDEALLSGARHSAPRR